MQLVARRARGLEDQLVLEETGRLAVQRADDVEQARIARRPFADRAQVDHRIEAVEAALAGLDVVLPAAADVVGVDQIGALTEAIGLGVELGDPIGGEHLPDHEVPVRPILRRLRGVDRADAGGVVMTLLGACAGVRVHVYVRRSRSLVAAQNRTPTLTPTVRGAPISPMKPDGAKLG